MKKPDKREVLNLFFSAFLVTAFVICAHFFNQFTSTLEPMIATLVSVAIYAVFGLLLFYATRVGDGVPVKRFSLPTLIFMVIPALYIIVASIATGLPFHDSFVGEGDQMKIIVVLACVALGYGIPYTFVSGYELEAPEAEDSSLVAGGIEEELEAAESEEAVETEVEASEAENSLAASLEDTVV